VAMTRARKNLFMTYATKSDKAKSVKQPAQYIIEVPEAYLRKSTDEAKESYIKAQQFVLANRNNLDISKETEESLRENIKNLKLTITHVNSYIKCPRCFFFNTILKIPKVKTESQSLGTVIHESLKFIQVNLNETGKIPDIKIIHARLEDILNREFLTSIKYDSVMEKSKKLLDKFVCGNKDFFVRHSITEKNMGPYSIIWEGIPIAGKIDLIKFNPDDKKIIEVIDFKTGNPDTKGSQLSQKGLGDYYRQLLFYKLLIESAPQLNWKVMMGTIKFIEPSREDGDKWIERSYDLNIQDYELLKAKVKEVYKKIQNLEFDECGEKCDNHQLHEINLGN